MPSEAPATYQNALTGARVEAMPDENARRLPLPEAISGFPAAILLAGPVS
jgi:hypothetical protein